MSFMCFFILQAQEIPLDVFILSKSDDVSEEAQANLESKIKQAILNQGFNGDYSFSPFAIIAEPSTVSKNIITGIQTTVALNVDLVLFIGNVKSNTKFSSTVIRLNGAGANETKAYIAALGNLNIGDSKLNSFIDNGKAKIINYYEKQTPTIISEAKILSVQHHYDEALCLLTSIPTVCSHYTMVEKEILDIWQQYVNYVGEKNLAKARSIWIAKQTSEAAQEAGSYLSEIYPDAKCYSGAMKLANDISSRIGDEWTFSKKIYLEGLSIEKQRIDAARAIGIAWGQGQPKSISNTTLLGW